MRANDAASKGTAEIPMGGSGEYCSVCAESHDAFESKKSKNGVRSVDKQKTESRAYTRLRVNGVYACAKTIAKET